MLGISRNLYPCCAIGNICEISSGGQSIRKLRFSIVPAASALVSVECTKTGMGFRSDWEDSESNGPVHDARLYLREAVVGGRQLVGRLFGRYTSEYPFPNVLWHVKPAREIAIKTTLMLIVGVTGISLNAIILLIIIKNKWLRNSSNYLIANLALVDLCTLLLCPWFMLVRDFYQQYVLKNFGCRFEGFLQATLLLAGVSAVILVSYDRLAAAAMTSDARITKKAAPKLAVASWLLPMALSIPWIYYREYMERPWLDYLETYCVENLLVLTIYWHIIICVLVWIPLGLMIVTYGAILWQLRRCAKELSARGGGNSVSRAKGRAFKVAAWVLLAAALCRIPFTVLSYWRNELVRQAQINAVVGVFEIVWFGANFLMYFNCALNPLIYGFSNERFRRAMDRTPGISWCRFGSWCCKSNKSTKKDPVVNKTEKIFVIEQTPIPDKKLTRMVKNIMHIHRGSIELGVPKIEEDQGWSRACIAGDDGKGEAVATRQVSLDLFKRAGFQSNEECVCDFVAKQLIEFLT
ncbi:Substance-K receptor [Eumeta japonica]|uniref:Substance-K receptor n=1 Tax=Eumeta variegata TaxID=151549 RepID=A0A4C1X032_EUMVA|nr:Substance-K receptor [Eumeta japonica]